MGVGNVYLEMAQKYNAKEVMSNWLDEHRKAGWEYLTIQGETFGEGIQKRGYIKGHDMRVFNVILGDESGVQIRLDPWRGKEFALSMISDVALGFIAFAIGHEFRLSALKQTGRQAVIIGILQAVT